MNRIALPLIAVVLAVCVLTGMIAPLTEWRLKKLRWRILTPDNCRRYLLACGWTETWRNEYFPKLEKGDLHIALTCVITAPVSHEAVLSAVDASMDSRNHCVVFTLVAPPESVVIEMLSRQISVIHYSQMNKLEQILRSDAMIIEKFKADLKILSTRALEPTTPAKLLTQTPRGAMESGCAREILIAETELVQCFFRYSGYDRLIIAFSDSWHKGREGRLLPRIDLAVLGYSVIDFVATAPNWFPADDMMALLQTVRQYLEGFARRITFGFSQGGYGALKYSTVLGANVSIAFSPQFSIDPRVVKGDRFGHLFRSDINIGMSLRPQECICPSYVFFDPFDKIDRRHVEFISRETSIHQVPMPFFGHGTAKLFSEPDRLAQLLAAGIEGDVAELHRIACQSRHINRDRAYLMTLHLTQRNPARALKIAQRYKVEWSHHKQADICYYLSMGGEIDAALSWCEQLAAKSPTSHNVLGCAAMVAMRAGEFGLAAGFIERARELNPGNAKWTWVEREIQTFKAKQIAAR